LSVLYFVYFASCDFRHPRSVDSDGKKYNNNVLRMYFSNILRKMNA